MLGIAVRLSPTRPSPPTILQDQSGYNKYDHEREDYRERHIAEKMRTARHAHDANKSGE